eukprot:494349-Rhodomonas_salina.1
MAVPGSGYTAEERTLNKKLCKVVGLGDTDAIKSLVKQGADPSYKVSAREVGRGGKKSERTRREEEPERARE